MRRGRYGARVLARSCQLASRRYTVLASHQLLKHQHHSLAFTVYYVWDKRKEATTDVVDIGKLLTDAPYVADGNGVRFDVTHYADLHSSYKRGKACKEDATRGMYLC
jgi:hypothetical protein